MKNIMKFRCPWHEEKTPSCHINIKRAFVHCFGCGHAATPTEFLDAMSSAGRETEVLELRVLFPR